MDYQKKRNFFLVLFLVAAIFPAVAISGEQLPDPETYLFGPGQSGKKTFDDPTDLTVKRAFKDYLPPEIWSRMTFDQEKMKKQKAELLGYTAPELVGKIAPEIKPGKYTYQDLEKYPGLKELFPPLVIKHMIKPGGPPLVGNIPEFEIVPQRGRLYRTQCYPSYNFMPEGGFANNYGGYAVQRDYLDLHSSIVMITSSPAPFSRSRFSMQELIKRGK